ncbi:hypothetical protein BJV78DRAFT_1196741 [Lactifluus subvellereus]|nr:hypothetical protein BJV78DRAFT_1196741 [Lactifluus subvellereus]
MNSLPTPLTTSCSARYKSLPTIARRMVAQNFNEQGNDYFEGKRYREALGFYMQGVEAEPADRRLREALLLNRAACNPELRNYGLVFRD